MVNQSTIIGLLLIISLFSSIALLSFLNQYPNDFKTLANYNFFAGTPNPLGVVCGLPEIFFFEAIWFLLALFRRVGTKQIVK